MNSFQDDDSFGTVIHKLWQPANRKTLLLPSQEITAYFDSWILGISYYLQFVLHW